MKKFFSMSIFILFLSFYFFPLKLSANQELPLSPGIQPQDKIASLDATISMDFKDANLKDILKIFSIQSGMNFIASQSLQDRRMTLYLDKVPIQEAMDKLFKANNLAYVLDKDSSVLIVKDLGEPQVDIITQVFFLKYATVSTSSLKEEMNKQMSSDTSSGSSSGSSGSGGASSGSGGGSGKWGAESDAGITKVIKKLLSENGSVIEDFRTNSLIVTDIPMRIAVVSQVIKTLDVSVPQVMLEVEMLDASKNVVDKLGFEWSSNSPFTLLIQPHGSSFFLGDLARRKIAQSATNAQGAVTFGGTFAQVLDFLTTQTDTKYLARPRLLTLNNETAEIKITTQESIGIKTTTYQATVSAEPERMETGVLLRVTPQINLETGEVTMFIFPQVASATAGNSLTSGSLTYTYRDPEIRSTKTMVKVKDGQTVVLGGLIRDEVLSVTQKIPILGDIPIIGWLFKHQGGSADKNIKRELLVFITPHIVKDAPIELAQAKKISLLEREQSPAAKIERESVISGNLDLLEKR